jgi:hypothetical protein
VIRVCGGDDEGSGDEGRGVGKACKKGIGREIWKIEKPPVGEGREAEEEEEIGSGGGYSRDRFVGEGEDGMSETAGAEAVLRTGMLVIDRRAFNSGLEPVGLDDGDPLLTFRSVSGLGRPFPRRQLASDPPSSSKVELPSCDDDGASSGSR